MLTEIINAVREILKRLSGTAAIEQRLALIEAKLDAVRADIKTLSDTLLGEPGEREASPELAALAERAGAVAAGSVELADRLTSITQGD